MEPVKPVFYRYYVRSLPSLCFVVLLFLGTDTHAHSRCVYSGNDSYVPYTVNDSYVPNVQISSILIPSLLIKMN